MKQAGFRNPVVAGFHPDPSVCRVGDDYFLVASTFTYFPAVPIFHSRNLVDWTQIGSVLDRPSQLDLSRTSHWSSAGIYAPTIRHHDGRFFMITTVFDLERMQTFFVTADDPFGAWSEPVPIDVVGVDPDLTWDDHGNCWLHSSIMAITRARIDDRNGAVLEVPQPTWSGTGLKSPEAPHVFRRDGVWYLVVAEGGTERGHAVSIARSGSPEGPWEPCPTNPILSHRSTDRPIQSTGHADFVEAADGSWWMVLLGVRPLGMTPQFHVLGRETFLVPVEWVDGWPVPGELLPQIPISPPGPSEAAVDAPDRDDFDGSKLEPLWLSVRRPWSEFASLTERHSHLVIHGHESSLSSPFPAYVGRRQQHLSCRASTAVDAPRHGRAGLALYHDDQAHYVVVLDGDRVVVHARCGPLASELASVARPEGEVTLWISTAPQRGGPDFVTLGLEHRDVRTELATVDGRFLSTEVNGGFIGRTIGVFAEDCVAAFDWFCYIGADE